MRKTLCLLGATILAASLVLSGCGGSSNSSSSVTPPTVTSVLRYVAGFVWVRGDAAQGTGPDALITASSTPPPGYFAPTAGTVTIGVADGDITRAADSEAFDMTADNKIIAIVRADSTSATGPFNMTVSASGLQFNGNPRTLSSATVSLGTPANSGTTLALEVGTPPTQPLTPGSPAAIEVLVRDREGNPGTATNPLRAPKPAGEDFVVGSSYDVAVAVFDADGTVITGLTPTITSSDPSAVSVVSGKLIPQTAGVPNTPVTITASIPSNTQSASFGGKLSFGTATGVKFKNLSKSELLWDTTGPVDSATVLVEVTNQYDAPMPGVTVTFSSPNVTSGNWSAPASGTALTPTSGTTNSSGQLTLAITGPTSAAGDSTTIANNPPKGANVITAAVGSVTDTVTVTIVRPVASFTITGPTRLDTNETAAYSVVSGVDVDGVNVPAPTGTVTWNISNTTASGNIGDPDDQSPRVGSAANISTTGVVTTGSNPGEAAVSATIGSVNSNTITVAIHGVPTKLKYTPATTATGYNSPGPINFEVSFLDSWGHTIDPDEITGLTKTASTSSGSNANVTGPAAPDRTFELTFTGTPASGSTMSVTMGGVWTGRAGAKTASFNITRSTNLN